MDNFEKSCRCCASTENKKTHHFFERKYDKELLCDIYYAFSSIKVSSMDGLPQVMCNSCYTRILNSYKFRKDCIKTEIKLSEIKSALKATKTESSEIYVKEQNVESENMVNEVLPKSDEDNDSDDEVNENDNTDEVSIKSDGSECENRRKKFAHTSNEILNTEDYDDKNSLNADIENLGNKKLFVRKKYKKSEGPRSCTTSPPRKKICSCKLLFDTLEELREHCSETGHKKGRIRKSYVRVCKICNKNVTQLRAHMLSHTGEKRFECEICGKRFSMKFNMKSHLLCHSGEKPYVCDICGVGFRQSFQMKEHRRLHSGEQPFVCNHCGEKFSTTSRYKYHLLKHPEDNPQLQMQKLNKTCKKKIKCDICQKELANKYYLKTHMLFHGDKNFLCSDCGKSFATKDGLSSHIRVHTGERPYTCSFCGRSFNHRKSHRAHELIHKGLKPYDCKICSKAFTQKTQLKIHLRTHTGEKPYICSLCGKNFSHSGSLKMHLKSHSPY